jgi:uncharacterized surface protein with fasciclin (FAS1) repeats
LDGFALSWHATFFLIPSFVCPSFLSNPFTNFCCVVDLVCSTEGLETLCALTAEACTTDGLETICDTVTGPGPFTVFAPSNSAFQELSMPLKDAIQNPEFLSDIIMSHVVEGKILSTDLVCDAAVTMANMEVTTTLCNDGDFYQSAPGNIDVLPKIVTTDVNASNGVVHVIDQVILPGDMNSNTPGQFPGGNYPKDCMDEVRSKSPTSPVLPTRTTGLASSDRANLDKCARGQPTGNCPAAATAIRAPLRWGRGRSP